jgi:hypothetical protein
MSSLIRAKRTFLSGTKGTFLSGTKRTFLSGNDRIFPQKVTSGLTFEVKKGKQVFNVPLDK